MKDEAIWLDERWTMVGELTDEVRSALVTLIGQDGEAWAEALWARYGSVGRMLSASPQELCGVLPPAVAYRIGAVHRLYGAVVQERLLARPHVKTPERVAEYLCMQYGWHDQERFGVLLLDINNRVTGAVVVATGGVNSVGLRVTDVLRPAIIAGSARMIIWHNHPSGETRPSQPDIDITHTIEDACRTMGITLVDHIIVGGNMYCSLKDEGLLSGE